MFLGLKGDPKESQRFGVFTNTQLCLPFEGNPELMLPRTPGMPLNLPLKTLDVLILDLGGKETKGNQTNFQTLSVDNLAAQLKARSLALDTRSCKSSWTRIA